MHATEIIGYAYGADVHCTHCTPAALKRPDATDAHGNPVHPIFASDSDCADDVCGDCGERLDGGPRRRPAKVYCLLDGARGQFLPQAYAQHYRHVGGIYGIDDDAWDILAVGPEHEQYWDTWADVLDTAELHSNEGTFTLHQDGDLYAIESGAQYDDRTGEWYVEV